MLRTETIEIASGGGRMPAYLAVPESGGSLSAVIVLMEAFGLVPNLEKETDRIAEMGYVAIAPDVYHRLAPDNTAPYDDVGRAVELMGRMDDGEFIDDMRATIGFLRSRTEVGASSIGVTGFCMGGRLSFLSACELPDEIQASAPFYGGGIGALLDRAGRIRCPLHLFFGQLDFFIPQDEVLQIDRKLSSLGIDYALENYEGAVHGFCCEERDESYHPKARKDAWSKLEAFFSRNL